MTTRKCMGCDGRGGHGTMDIPYPGGLSYHTCSDCNGSGVEEIGGRFCDIPDGGLFWAHRTLCAKLHPYRDPGGFPSNAIVVRPIERAGLLRRYPPERKVIPFDGDWK